MSKFFFLLAAICFAACNNQSQVSGNQKTIDSLRAMINQDHSSDAAAIRSLDSSWDKESEAKSVDGWLAFYSDDAIMMPPEEKICTDAASRKASIKNMFATPGVSLRFQTTKAEVSRMGDLGYAVGVYQWKSQDAKGKDYHETGKYSEIWKKQANGTWKCIVDIWNADPQTSM